MSRIYRIYFGSGAYLVHAINNDDFSFFHACFEALFIVDRVAQSDIATLYQTLVIYHVNIAFIGIMHDRRNIG